ncbi:MAG TPA: hypothetical protein VN132_08710, partial [Bdellovibrio sp.]|nr:hypothetical protein [Bdellovibrio sp.]
VFLAGCISIPRDQMAVPKEIAPLCVAVEFDRFREGPVSREIEAFPMEPAVVANYRASLRKFGIETECSNPIDKFSFRYVVKGGMKIPSFDLLLYTASIFTLGIIPYKSDMVVEMTYQHQLKGEVTNKENTNYLVPVTQWISIFTIPKEISQKKEARDVYNISNYWDAIIVAKTAEIIFNELKSNNSDQKTVVNKK